MTAAEPTADVSCPSCHQGYWVTNPGECPFVGCPECEELLCPCGEHHAGEECPSDLPVTSLAELDDARGAVLAFVGAAVTVLGTLLALVAWTRGWVG